MICYELWRLFIMNTKNFINHAKFTAKFHCDLLSNKSTFYKKCFKSDILKMKWIENFSRTNLFSKSVKNKNYLFTRVRWKKIFFFIALVTFAKSNNYTRDCSCIYFRPTEQWVVNNKNSLYRTQIQFKRVASSSSKIRIYQRKFIRTVRRDNYLGIEKYIL